MLKMEKTYIDEHQIDQKYLRGQLTPEESAAFENYLMENETLVDQLELDTLMIQAMPQAVQPQDKTASTQRWWAFIATPMRASLATFVVCLLVFPFGYKTLFDAGEPGDQVIANIPMVYLAPVRGGDITPSALIQLKSTDRYFELSVEVGDRSATHYQNDIFDRKNGKQMLMPHQYEVMSSREIRLMLPSGGYPSGDYQVLAEPIGSARPGETFHFSVLR